MPQIIPCIWILIFLFLISSLFILISFIYFFYLPLMKQSQLTLLFNKWNWKW